MKKQEAAGKSLSSERDINCIIGARDTKAVSLQLRMDALMATERDKEGFGECKIKSVEARAEQQLNAKCC